MTSAVTNVPRRPSQGMQPGAAVRGIGWLMAAWCVAFAVVNIVFESTDHFADGEYAAYSAAFTAMNWLVVGLKLVGAAVAALSVAKRPLPLPPRLVGVMVWGVFATLAVYALGGIGQGFGTVVGLREGAVQADLAAVAYLAFFLFAATGWGVLAVSYSKRRAPGWGPVVLGTLAAPLVLGSVLVAMPALLATLGLMPG